MMMTANDRNVIMKQIKNKLNNGDDMLMIRIILAARCCQYHREDDHNVHHNRNDSGHPHIGDHANDGSKKNLDMS